MGKFKKNFIVLAIVMIVGLLGFGYNARALTLEQARNELQQILGSGRSLSGSTGDLATTAYLNSRINGTSPVEAVRSIFTNNGGIRTATNPAGDTVGATGDGSYWVHVGNEWQRINGSPNITFQNLSTDNTPINGSHYNTSSIDLNNNVQPLSDDALHQAIQEFRSSPDNDNQDILEPNPLSVDDSQDNPANQPSNQTPGQTATGQQTPGQTGSNQQSTPNQTVNSGATVSNGNVAGSNNTNATADCGTEGLEGQRFLFFRGPLVPCGVNKHCAGNNNLSIDKPCTLCHFFVLIQNFFNFLLSLLIVVSIFMLTIAGVLYIISAGGRMATVAKEIIQKTLLGFGLFLLSWLIVFTLLKLLAVNTSMLGTGSSWFQFTCDDESAFWVPTENDGNTSRIEDGNTGRLDDGNTSRTNDGNTNKENNPSPSVTATNADEREQAYRNMLRNAGIRINHNNHCTSPNESGCTTLVGAREYTLNKIMQLKADDCPSCDIQVNAVTDKWIDSNGVAHTNQEAHSTDSPYSHDNGYKVDYLATPSLNRHLTGVSNASQLSSIPDGQTNGVLTRAGSRGGEYGGPRFYDNEGNEWVYETSKGVWDVKYDQGASHH